MIGGLTCGKPLCFDAPLSSTIRLINQGHGIVAGSLFHFPRKLSAVAFLYYNFLWADCATPSAGWPPDVAYPRRYSFRVPCDGVALRHRRWRRRGLLFKNPPQVAQLCQPGDRPMDMGLAYLLYVASDTVDGVWRLRVVSLWAYMFH
jgi:hypothetical protein